MQAETAARLLEINREFYQQFAESFDATRRRLQPGVAGLLPDILNRKRVLDLGCGNGELAVELRRKGFAGEYTGIDFSEKLVELARERAGWINARVQYGHEFPGPQKKSGNAGRISGAGDGSVFLARHLAEDAWADGLEPHFDAALMFAVLHHLPAPVPAIVLGRLRELLAPDGVLMLSCWQFLNSSRWRGRVQPWEAAGLAAESVDANDYLLDWRRDGAGLRYVHHFSEAELESLSTETGYSIVKSFSSDGKGGDLALYQIWMPI